MSVTPSHAEPSLFHDPTSEPSRAVHWFCVEASVPVAIHPVYLTRGEHLSRKFLAINPRHQVPALSHGETTLSEATAIMRYLAELSHCEANWLGHDIGGRARINQLLSWYHTNLRLKATLNYFLPVVLAPAYTAARKPSDAEILGIGKALREALSQLDAFFGETLFLVGDTVTIPDLLFACELFALDADPERDSYLSSYDNVVAWLDRLRERPGYEASHRCWNAVAPRVREILAGDSVPSKDPAWVAALCEAIDGQEAP